MRRATRRPRRRRRLRSAGDTVAATMDPAAANAPAPPSSGSGSPGPDGSASVKAGPAAAAGLVVRFGDFGLDEANARLVRLGGTPVELQPKAFAVLCALVRRGGQLVTKDALLVKVQDGKVVGKMSLDQWRAVIDVNLTGVFLGAR